MNRTIFQLNGLAILALLSGCFHSDISTKSSAVTTAYSAEPEAVMLALEAVSKSKADYQYSVSGPTEARIVYNPKGIMNSHATVEVKASSVSGTNQRGEKVTGTKLMFKDVTAWLLADVSFSGMDVARELESGLKEYMQFKGVKFEPVMQE